MMEDSFYDEEYDEEIARIFEEKVKEECIKKGLSREEAELKAREAYLQKRREKLKEFLKKMQEKIASLPNQDIANLLLSLMALGLNIEDEEELEFWLKKLEFEALNRIMMYFQQKSLCDNKITFAHKFSPKEMAFYEKMAKGINVAYARKYQNAKSGKEFNKMQKALEKAYKIIVKDVSFQQKQLQKENAQSNKKVDWEAAMKDKLNANGVTSGMDYFKDVMTNFNSSGNQEKFYKKWELDSERLYQEKIKELRGFEEVSKNNQQVDDSKKENRREQNQNSRPTPQRAGNSR